MFRGLPMNRGLIGMQDDFIVRERDAIRVAFAALDVLVIESRDNLCSMEFEYLIFSEKLPLVSAGTAIPRYRILFNRETADASFVLDTGKREFPKDKREVFLGGR